MRLMLVVGARPQIIKSAPIVHEARKHGEIELQLIHTGQHYDFEMSKVFFDEMALPEPLVNLGIGSGSHAWQTGNMMIELEKTMVEHKPDMVVVPGDTNSTLAGAIAAAKLHVPVAHVEAGARSYDMRMPEEINRRLTDHSSSLLFAPTRNCAKNLDLEGFPKKAVKVPGDTMYDALLRHASASLRTDILRKLELRSEEYATLTLHRPENVDDPESLGRIVKAIMSLKLTTVFPVHPRTRKRLAETGLLARIQKNAHIKLTDPLRYCEMLQLTKHSKMVFTDSGGLQKEAFWLHTPCITLRERTEWIETTRSDANFLVGSNPKRIGKGAARIMEAPEIKRRLEKIKNPFGDGHASQRIISEILKSR
jgi:UDP-N-acetylglucosamine 2-epimerase